MILAKRRVALRTWDSKVVAAYIGQTECNQVGTDTRCEVTLQRVHARNLNFVVADIALRSSELPGMSMATFDRLRMRDAALRFAIDRYLAVLPNPDQRDGDNQRQGGNRIAERILVGLILRREQDAHARLARLTVALPATVCAALDAEVGRVLRGIDLTDLNGWHGDLATDVRSSLVEAIVAEWMHQRAEAFGIALGRDRPHAGWRPRRPSRGEC